MKPGDNERATFRAWLLKGYRLAVRARGMTAVSLRPSANAPTPAKPQSHKVSCGKCGTMGHRAGECTLDGTLAAVEDARRDAAKEHRFCVFG